MLRFYRKGDPWGSFLQGLEIELAWEDEKNAVTGKTSQR
jgi:hypothetical protein